MDLILSPNRYDTRSKKIRLIVVHSTQGPGAPTWAVPTARGIAGYFQNPAAKVSSHYVCDEVETVQCVPDEGTAFCAPNANSDGLHIEQCGYAEYTRDEWLTGDNLVMLTQQVAPLVASLAAKHGIPLVPLTADQVAAGHSGICDHFDITNAFPGTGSHWDCGGDYPMDVLLALAAGSTFAPAEPPTPVRTGVQPVAIPATLRPGTGLPEQGVWVYDVSHLYAEGAVVGNQAGDGPKVKASTLVVRHAVPNGDTPKANLTVVWGSGATGFTAGGITVNGAEVKRFACPKDGIVSVISDRPLVVHGEIYT